MFGSALCSSKNLAISVLPASASKVTHAHAHVHTQARASFGGEWYREVGGREAARVHKARQGSGYSVRNRRACRRRETPSAVTLMSKRMSGPSIWRPTGIYPNSGSHHARKHHARTHARRARQQLQNHPAVQAHGKLRNKTTFADNYVSQTLECIFGAG